MSIPVSVTVECKKCGHSFSVIAFDSVNTDYSNNVAEKIMNGEFFQAKCPKCGEIARLSYNLLYHDIKRKAMINVVLKSSQNYKKLIKETRKIVVPNYKTLRIVEDIYELREKVTCLEFDRDDRVIEIYKVLAANHISEEYPDFPLHKVFYALSDDGHEIFICCNATGDKQYNCLFEEEMYDKLTNLYYNSSIFKNFDSNFPIINFAWATEVLTCLGDEIEDSAEPENTELENPEKSSVICPNCNNELPLDSEFCQYCGKAIHNVKQAQKENICAKKKEKAKPKVKKEKKKKDTKRIKKIVKRSLFIALSSICAMALIFVILTHLVLPAHMYNEAKELMKEGKYERAQVTFKNMQNTSIMPIMPYSYWELADNGIDDCDIAIYNIVNRTAERYNEAIKNITAGEYISAYETLIEIPEYKDSAETASAIYESYKAQKFKEADVGSTLFFGRYEQDCDSNNGYEDIEWLVLDIKDGRALVISKYNLTSKKYNDSSEIATWENCSLRQWLNNEFYNTAFNENEKAKIQTVTVEPVSFAGITSSATKDNIYILSDVEIRQYFKSDNEKNTTPTKYAQEIGCGNNYRLRCVDDSDSVKIDNPYSSSPGIGVAVDPQVLYKVTMRQFYGVRPAMWIDISK